MKKQKNWIKAAAKKPIAINLDLKINPGEKIPQSKLTKSLQTASPIQRKQTNLTRTLRGIRK